MGEVDLNSDDDEDLSFIGNTIKDPDFFVVDDMYNRHDRLSHVECDPSKIKAVLLESLVDMLRLFPDWWVSFSMDDSGLAIVSDAVLVGGRRFWDCTSISEIDARCRQPVNFGPPEPLTDEMGKLWRQILIGGIHEATRLPEAPTRQWAEVIRTLTIMRARKNNHRLTAFAYDQVRHDLHPATRRELLLGLLRDISGFDPATLAAAKRNVQKDCCLALTESGSPEGVIELTDAIWSALDNVIDRLGANEVVNWWADILAGIKKLPNGLARILDEDIRVRLAHSNPLIKLCALFGLAKLQAVDISSLVDDAITKHPDWARNPNLMDWLGKLKRGKSYYPDRNMLSYPQAPSP